MTRLFIALLFALVVLVACGCDREEIASTPSGADDGTAKPTSGQGESCTKTADCNAGLKCVQLVCLSGDEPITIDNADTERIEQSGGWEVSDNGTGPWNGSFLYHRAQRDPVAWVRFLIDIGEVRNYDVYLWWSAMEDRTTTQPVIIQDAKGDHHLATVNLREPPPAEWFGIGTFSLGPGSFVEFNTDTDTDPAGNDFCNADAIRLVPVP